MRSGLRTCQGGVGGAAVEILCGDVAFQLGLSEDKYRELVGSVCLVVHLAAVVNVKEDYPFHRRTNVLGTLNVLRFAAAAGARLLFAATTDGLWRRYADVC